jgi:hypothetical protein
MTISKITFHPEAAAEVEAAFTWYQARSVRAAGSFLKALELKDRVHIQDMDAAGLIAAEVEGGLPNELRQRLAEIRSTQ